MSKKLPTLSVAIPSFNEEGNIKNLLISLIKQKSSNFIFKDVTVTLDGSTDNTEKLVKEIMKKYDLVKLIKNKDRRGKYFRLNQIFKKCKSDILVILDADIKIEDTHFLEKLASTIIKNPKAVLVPAHQVLIRPNSFIANIIYTELNLWNHVRWSIKGYNNQSNYFGSATAYRGSFVRKLQIPGGLSDPHLYIFLSADKINGFKYCPEAIMLEKSIATFSDFNKLLHRSIGKRDQKLEEMFGDRVRITREIKFGNKFTGLIKSFIYEPFFTPLALLLVLYTKFSPLMNVDKTPIWEIVKSTKR